jgi:glycosyltransferase involved in cell wall biosynthesis
VANFPSNTGYAWNFIEGLYAGIADRLAERGVRSFVAYPEIPAPPETLRGSAARAVELRVRVDEPRCLPAILRFVRSHDIRVVYLTDLHAWHPAYTLLRGCGVERIVVHDHTSGERSAPRGLRRAVKRMTRRIPGMMADQIVCVSDFVARRKVASDLVPEERVTRVWNSLAIPERARDAAQRTRQALGIAGERPVIACACRSVPEKGVAHLLRAFDRLVSRDPGSASRPVLVYMGNGPILRELEALRASLTHAEDILFTGYRDDAVELLEGVDVCVVPSVWQEAFGLAALEPMARGVAVVASRVGGIPEVVVDGETGLLVAPGDDAALEEALRALLADPERRRRLGANGRRRAERHFSIEGEIDDLTRLLFPEQRS